MSSPRTSGCCARSASKTTRSGFRWPTSPSAALDELRRAVRRTAVRADQRRRRVAEQALAGRSGSASSRRSCARRARSSRSCCGGRGRRRWRTQSIAASSGTAMRGAAHGRRGPRRARARRRARRVRRHRSAAYRDGRRHADGQSVRADRSRAQRPVCRRRTSWCRATRRAAATTTGAATSPIGASHGDGGGGLCRGAAAAGGAERAWLTGAISRPRLVALSSRPWRAGGSRSATCSPSPRSGSRARRRHRWRSAGALAPSAKRCASGRPVISRKGARSRPPVRMRLTRHPLYLGSSIMGVGFAIAANQRLVAVIVLLYLVVTITAAIRTEEAHLTDKFGAHYPAYRARAASAPVRAPVQPRARGAQSRVPGAGGLSW